MKKIALLFCLLPLAAFAQLGPNHTYALVCAVPCTFINQDIGGLTSQSTEPSGYIVSTFQWDGLSPINFGVGMEAKPDDDGSLIVGKTTTP